MIHMNIRPIRVTYLWPGQLGCNDLRLGYDLLSN